MNTFSATVESEAVISAARDKVWAALIDPTLLPQLTPLLTGIDAAGTTWTWHMMRISALGVSISPTFTEAMTFQPTSRIAFTHRAPVGQLEHAGAEGWYELADTSGGTQLTIRLTLSVDLPLPRATAPAVQAVMKRTMTVTGDRFSRNLLAYLGARQLDSGTAR